MLLVLVQEISQEIRNKFAASSYKTVADKEADAIFPTMLLGPIQTLT